MIVYVDVVVGLNREAEGKGHFCRHVDGRL